VNLSEDSDVLSRPSLREASCNTAGNTDTGTTEPNLLPSFCISGGFVLHSDMGGGNWSLYFLIDVFPDYISLWWESCTVMGCDANGGGLLYHVGGIMSVLVPLHQNETPA